VTSNNDIHAHRLLILDFGSQYTQLIARRVREIGVYCEIYPYDVDVDDIRAFEPMGIILSGGPETVTGDDAPQAPQVVFDAGVPLLGICYGMQTMAAQLGGVVETSAQHEYGYAQVRARGHSRLLTDIEDHTTPEGYGLLDVWMSHGDRVVELPAGFKVGASTDSAPIAAMADDERGYYGIQFHPEVTHTRQGERILQRFVIDICGCDALWTADHIVSSSIRDIQAQVGDGNVLLGLSGGVDSSVVAALLHKAIGDQLVCVFVDNGLLRYREGDQVMATFAEHMGVRVLQGETEWLAQGTIYPDVIESAGAKTGKAHLIKSHHNVGGLPEHMRMQLCEPLRELFKDEVRKLGVELGLPYDMVYRHPFPGPGLGVRILGEVKKEYADTLRLADHIFIEELRKHDLYDTVSQAFTVFLPVKSVGVTGDGRRYSHVVALRAVETIDFMTARWAHLPYEFLDLVSRRIINEVPDISRVAYDISGKPPATIEWE
jgi:GMP synthase (glutamine-hydrolysing)